MIEIASIPSAIVVATILGQLQDQAATAPTRVALTELQVTPAILQRLQIKALPHLPVSGKHLPQATLPLTIQNLETRRRWRDVSFPITRACGPRRGSTGFSSHKTKTVLEVTHGGLNRSDHRRLHSNPAS
jgi:hypothetical protein